MQPPQRLLLGAQRLEPLCLRGFEFLGLPQLAECAGQALVGGSLRRGGRVQGVRRHVRVPPSLRGNGRRAVGALPLRACLADRVLELRAGARQLDAGLPLALAKARRLVSRRPELLAHRRQLGGAARTG